LPGGIYFVAVTAVEAMGFGTSAAGVKAFIDCLPRQAP
jgi:hypothetical protein